MTSGLKCNFNPLPSWERVSACPFSIFVFLGSKKLFAPLSVSWAASKPSLRRNISLNFGIPHNVEIAHLSYVTISLKGSYSSGAAEALQHWVHKFKVF